MTKTITIEDTTRQKASSKEMIQLTSKVKSKTGKIGTTGILKDNILFKIVKGGFIIF